jgi:hypothetical protein
MSRNLLQGPVFLLQILVCDRALGGARDVARVFGEDAAGFLRFERLLRFLAGGDIFRVGLEIAVAPERNRSAPRDFRKTSLRLLAAAA